MTIEFPDDLSNIIDDTSFILSVQDENLLAVPGVLVETQRYYPGLDQFKTVQVGKTDISGLSGPPVSPDTSGFSGSSGTL